MAITKRVTVMTTNEIYAKIMSLRDKVHCLNEQIDIHHRGIQQLLIERRNSVNWDQYRIRVWNFQILGNRVRILDLRHRIDNLNNEILDLHEEIDRINDS
ncbi:MAG: 12 kDa unknown protein [Plant associated soymovirus 1]|nr:MAG: 12 kDa unknown protein [Plant associated soymovirus 1]